jgi:hypothetical protein
MDNLLSSFNSVANEFIDKMIVAYPCEPKLKLCKTVYLATKKYNNKKPLEFFMATLLPYGEEIVRRNEHFFKQDDLVDKAQTFTGQTGLCDYWEQMTPENKSYVWEYIQTLYILGMKILGKEEELRQIMDRGMQTQ